MSSREKHNGGTTCPTCREYIDPNEFSKHVRTCNKRHDEEDNNDESSMKQCGFCNKSTRNLAKHMETCDRGSNSIRNGSSVLRNSSIGSSNSSSISSRNRGKKQCPICSEMFDQDVYYDHIDDCGCDVVQYSTPSNQYHDENRDNSRDKDHSIINTTYNSSRVVNRGNQSMKSSMSPKNTKQCNSCSQLIDERDYSDHVDQCGIEPPSQYDRTSIRKSKQCKTCNEMIPKDEYLNHADQCAGRSRSKPSKLKQCQTCDEMIPQDDYADHMYRCARRSQPKPSKLKQCQTCDEMIPQDDYADHMYRCARRSRPKPSKLKQCQTCDEMIPQDDYVDHIGQCQNRKPYKKPSIVRENSTEACPLCFKEFPTNELSNHASRCNGPSSTSKSTPTVAKTTLKTCTTCSAPIDTVKNSSLVIPCQSKHAYCTNCLQQAMNQHLESNTPPVCNSQMCDYELSKYNVCCLPLNNDLIQRLLPLVKSMQRAQCPTCLFYVEMDKMADFEKHVSRCTGDGIPCQYCNCPTNMNELNDHENACRRSEPSDRLQAYQNFILSRTKYPMTIHELRVFLEERRKSHLPNDAHDIVNTLAEFGGVFPYDIPTRDCDICMNPFVYDDIFVFGCDENHKACYECFAESTETKMKNNEILTCVMCNYQLLDGEIKQLKIPAERRRQYIDYQANKTFSIYAGGQGILRCPNKGCKWMVELENPNQRFKVTCHMCQHEFCSLCSQQYHYQTTCQEIPDLTQRWFFWCNTERGNYWQARAQQDASYRTQLEDYQKQRVANEQRNEELRRRYDELLADEQYKAQNCRLCPHCRRVVQHLSGCDLMVCGRNYHGGDDQSGCGQGFRWSQALPYQPVNTGPQQVTNNIAAPEQQKLVVHTGVQCDACHTEVQGIRFDCVHCSSLIFCEKCEQRGTLQHSEELRNQNKTQHVFKMITTAKK